MQISIHLNLFTSTPFFDCLPLFFGSGMKPKVRARAAKWRSPRPCLYEICSSRWTTLRRHQQSDGEETDNCSQKKTDIFFLSIGGNDISPISKPEKIYDDIKSLIEILKEAVYFAFASILVCPQFEDYHQWSARREMVVEV